MDTVDLDYDAWLTTREAANIIGCGERKLLRLIESGEIEAHKDGRSYLVSLTSARAYRRRATNQKGKGRANGEGSVFESPKGSGKWQAVLTIKVDTKTKRIRRLADSQKEALKRLEELKEEFGRDGLQGSHQTDQQTLRIIPPSIRELFDEWLEAISKTVKKNTLFSYRKACERWLLPRIGEYSVDLLTSKDLQTVFNDLAELYAPNTVHRAHTPIKCALEYAIDQGYVTQNVAAKVKLPPMRNKFPGIALKVKELRAILRVADAHRLRVLIYLIALLGLRLGEGIGVREQDLDSDDDILGINEQLQSIGGSRPQTETPKSDSGIRLLPLPRRLSSMVREYINQTKQAQEIMGSDTPDTNLIFLSEKSTPLWPRNVERLFASIVEQAGLAKVYPAVPRTARPLEASPIGTAKKSKYKPKKCAVCVHDLRRTQLTLLGDLGVDESTKMRIAGHGPKNVTMRYDRGTLERIRAALQALEDLILGEEE